MKKILMAENQEFYSDVKIGAHHYAENFSQNGYEVLWLSPSFSFIHKLYKAPNVKERLRLNNNKRIELKKNIYGYAPKVIIPFVNCKILNSKFVGKYHIKTIIPSIKSELKRLGFYEVDILWISNVKMLYLKDVIKYKKLIYRVADEKKGFDNFNSTLSLMEDELKKESDILYATSHQLVDTCKKLRNDVRYLPNGVNCEDFRIEEKQEHNKKKKTCIYIGAIAKWLDIDLIKNTISAMEDVNFIFIGPKHIEFEEITNMKNVKYLGKKPYSELKSYLAEADVAWIPFRINELTNAINPVKLYEYLAAGTPTVSTNFLEMSYIEGPFEICSTYVEVINSLNKCIEGYYKADELISFANNNTWKARFQQIIRDVE